MPNKDTIYVWESGSWIYKEDYSEASHKNLGKYQAFMVGSGFERWEVQNLVDQYLRDLWSEEG